MNVRLLAVGCLWALAGPVPAAETAQDHVRSGEALLVAKRPAEARVQFQAALAMNPSLVPARTGSIRALLAQNEFRLAIAEAEEARKGNPGSRDLDRIAGIAYYLAGDYGNANRLFTDLVRTSPRDAEARYYLGRMLLSEYGNRAALELFNAAAALDPNNASYQHYRGVALRRLGLLDHASEAFTVADRLDPSQAGPPLYRGWIALEQGRYDEADRFLSESIRRDPSLAQAHFRLALVRIKKDRLPEARDSLRKAIDLFSGFDLAWYNLGKVYTMMGEKEKADEAFAQFRQLAPIADRISELRQTLARSPGDVAAQRELRELLARVAAISGDPEPR